VSATSVGNEADDYRADIDGLRAIAILSVVFYHWNFHGFSGGFVGVDIFFVISGFLVTRIILNEAETTGRFDIVSFWSRRARRLLPNAVLTLSCVLIVGLLVLPAYRIGDFASEIAAAALYGANFLFMWRAADYFAHHDPASPVAHFWSLSVEEQFYLVWPLMVLALLPLLRGRKPRVVLASILAAIILISFVGSLLAVRENQPLAFYHTAFRAWQLALGAIIATLAPEAARLGRFAGAAGLAGTVAIVSSVTLLSSDIVYPDVVALVPTLGTAALIASGMNGSGMLQRQLSRRWLVEIGRRSYSLYLWHWPVQVFVEHQMPVASAMRLTIIVVATVCLAEAAFRFVEEPARRRAFPGWRPVRIVLLGMGASLATAGASVLVHRASLLWPTPGTIPTAELSKAWVDYGRVYPTGCHRAYEQVDQPECAFGLVGAGKTAVLFGDSHAAQWFEPLDIAARETGWALKSWTKTSCPSINLQVWFVPRKAVYHQCEEWRRNAMDRLLGPDKPDLVIISNLWNYAGWMTNADGVVMRGRAAANAVWVDAMQRTLRQFSDAGIRVLVIRDTPQAYRSYRQCLASNGGASCDRKREDAESVADVVFRTNRDENVAFVDLTDAICGDVVCPVIKDGMIVYHDHHHLTATFARTLSPLLADALRRVQEPGRAGSSSPERSH
jgi:peptidoglycan/LPS O-acetylase OafA/YrhL